MISFISVSLYTPSISTTPILPQTCSNHLRGSRPNTIPFVPFSRTAFLNPLTPVWSKAHRADQSHTVFTIKCDTSEATTLVDQHKAQHEWRQKLSPGSIVEVWVNGQIQFGVVQSAYDHGANAALIQVTDGSVSLKDVGKVSFGEVIAVWPTTLIAPSNEAGSNLIRAVQDGYKLLRHASPKTIDLTKVYTAMCRLPKTHPKSSLTSAEICHALFRPHPSHTPHRRATLTVATAVLLAADSVRFKRSQPGHGWRALLPSVTVARGRCSFVDACTAILDRRRNGDTKRTTVAWSREQLDILRDLEIVAASGTSARGTAASVLEALGYAPNDDGAATLLLGINYWATGSGAKTERLSERPSNDSYSSKSGVDSHGRRKVGANALTAAAAAASAQRNLDDREWTFAPALLAEARDIRAATRERKRAYMEAREALHGSRRRNLLHPPDGHNVMRAYCIDDKASRFLDDAISVQILNNGAIIRLWVHIADVDEIIRSGSALDEFAKERGQSLYLPVKPLHMLPVAAMDAASFSTTYATEAVTVMLECDVRRDVVRNWEVFASVVPPVKRISYDQFDLALNRGARTAQVDTETYEDLKHIAYVAPLLAEKLDNRKSSRKQRETRRVEEDNAGALDMFEERPIASVRLVRRSDKAGTKGAGRIAKIVNFQMTGSHLAVDDILTCAGGVMRQFARENRAYLPEGRDAFLYVGRCGTAPLRRYGDLAVQRQIKCVLFGRQPAGKRRMDELKLWLAKRQAATEKTVMERRRSALFDSFSSFCAQKCVATGAQKATVRGQVRNVVVTKRGALRVDVALDGTGLSTTASVAEDVAKDILNDRNDVHDSTTVGDGETKNDRILRIVRNRLRPHTQVQVEIIKVDTVAYVIQARIVQVLE